MNTPDDAEELAPPLPELTLTLGRTFKSISEQDPAGTPSERAAAAFAAWLAEAGPVSVKPGYFADVADNFVVSENSNKDLFDLFDLLVNYIELEVEEPEPPAPRTFIGLPMADSR
jgi:hypothetical protein